MFRARWRLRRWRGLLAVVVITPLLALGSAFWRASGIKEETAEEVRAQARLPLRVVSLDRTAPAGIDPIAASPGFRDLAVYQDWIAVSARAGLFLYDRSGVLVHSYRVGLELPPAELGAMSVGIAAGASEPELFIATRGEGVLAYNGARFRQMLPGEAGARMITSLLVLASGRVLLGTEHQGLLVFDGQRLTHFHARLKSAHITSIAGTDGDLWIGTLANGVFHYRGGELEDLLGALPDPQVISLALSDGAAYAGTPLGVVEFRDGRRQRTLASGFFARAMVRRGETLYVGTEDEGIVAVPLESRIRPQVPSEDGPAPMPVKRLAELEGGLYAVDDRVIYRYRANGEKWRPVIAESGAPLADRNVASLALVRGRLWVGYFDRGLDVLDASLERAEHREDDALFCINRIVTDDDGMRTAVATANGLVMFDSTGQPRQILGHKDGLLADHVTDVAFREGGMVVATPAGLSFVDRTGVRSLYVFHGLVNNHVYAVAAQGDRVVAGTLGGVSVLDDGGVLVNYTTANSRLKHNWITALVRVGDEWFAGTYGAGVLRLDANGEWHSFPDLKDGFVVNPNAMLVSGGQVYAGSLDRGLYVFDRASGRWSNTLAGLPSKNVTALAIGGGFLYAGTDNGVVRIAEGALR